MIPLSIHLRAQVVLIVSFGVAVTILLALLPGIEHTSNSIGWSLAVFWTLALLAEAIRRIFQGRYPEVRMDTLTHRSMLVLSAFAMTLGGVERVVLGSMFIDPRAWWMEVYLFNILTDSYGSIFFMVACTILTMAGINAGFFRLRTMFRTSSTRAGGVGTDLFFVLLILLVVATVASPVHRWTARMTLVDSVIDSWYTAPYVDNGPMQYALYALVGFVNVLLTQRWVRRSDRLAAVRTLFFVVVLWAVPLTVDIVRFGADRLLLFDRGDMIAWTTMLIPCTMFVVASFPAFKMRIVELWRTRV